MYAYTYMHTKDYCLCLTVLFGLFVLQGQGTRMFWKPQPTTLSLVNKQAKNKHLHHSKFTPLTPNYPSLLTLSSTANAAATTIPLLIFNMVECCSSFIERLRTTT